MIPYGRHSVSSLDALRVAYQVRFRSLTQGRRIQLFEDAVSQFVGSRYAVAVSSATAGLHLAVESLRLGTNAEIITSPISFVASSNSVLYANHKPIFADIHPDSLLLDFNRISEVITANSKAVISVHFAGLPDEPEDLIRAREKNGLLIIEDAAHSFGAEYSNGQKVGSCTYSDMTVFSFHPVKSMTTGEGGIITTNDEEIYKRLLRLRSHGINKLETDFIDNILAKTLGEKNPWFYEMLDLGYNYRLTEIQAELGLSQLAKVNRFVSQRRRLALNYQYLLQNNSLCEPAQRVETSHSAHHIFPLRVHFDKIRISRSEIMQKLRSEGIGTQVHYIPIPLHPFYQAMDYDISHLREAIKYYSQALTIPLFPQLSKKNQSLVLQTLDKVLSHN